MLYSLTHRIVLRVEYFALTGGHDEDVVYHKHCCK